MEKLFMVLLGCKPDGRLTEQHDIFFGIARNLKELAPKINHFWPDAKGKIHIDAWREVTSIDGYRISIVPKQQSANDKHLYFINLGGYKENDLEEYHYKMLIIANSLSQATKLSKDSAFFKHYNLPGHGVSHVDDKYGIDVDDVYIVNDILPQSDREVYSIDICKNPGLQDNVLHIGYLPLTKV